MRPPSATVVVFVATLLLCVVESVAFGLVGLGWFCGLSVGMMVAALSDELYRVYRPAAHSDRLRA